MRWSIWKRDGKEPYWLTWEGNDEQEEKFDLARRVRLKLYRRDKESMACLILDRVGLGDIWEWFENCYTFEKDRWLESCLNLYAVPDGLDFYFRITVYSDRHKNYNEYIENQSLISFAEIRWFPKKKLHLA